MESLCPHTDSVVIEGRSFTSAEVIEALSSYVRPERQETIRAVVEKRTYTVTPVLEGVHDRGNISAVMRTAESLGYQSLHIIETERFFRKANRVTQGADKWLDVSRWPTTRECMGHLRGRGYRIVVTDMNADSKPIGDVSFDVPTALFFGNEGTGASDELIEAADDCVVVPMDGFTQSFNISVAAALSLYHIQQARIREFGSHADLTEAEKQNLLASYFMRSVNRSKEILVRLRDEKSQELA
ncbi:MAG: RNA methyltransferase [Candidatus Hydrogenedentota bacterium]